MARDMRFNVIDMKTMLLCWREEFVGVVKKVAFKVKVKWKSRRKDANSSQPNGVTRPRAGLRHVARLRLSTALLNSGCRIFDVTRSACRRDSMNEYTKTFLTRDTT